MSSLFMELTKQQKLLQMMEERGFTLCQQNGQRTYGGPPPNWGSRPPPSRDCEVFIGRLPRTCFEDELIPLFLTVGELYEFRLMLDFSGSNRGYGYAHYATLAGATNAIKILNKYEIRPGHHIGVLKSKNNCRLLFGNIRSSITFEEFNEFIRSVTDHVLKVFMFTNFNQLKMSESSINVEVEEAFLSRMPRNNGNNQFAIVEYENHKAAAVARRVLIPNYGHILAIDWAVPPRERRRSMPSDSVLSTIPCRLLQGHDGARGTCVPVNYSAKARPVPTLMTRASVFDNLPFLPKVFENVVKYFKYLINSSLHRSVLRAEIPLHIYREMEKKIVERITNLENCGQAIQLIFNYLSWFNEKKPNTIDSESHKVLQEVKIYSDSFVHFIFNKISYGPPANPVLDNYYCNVLPMQLNFIFHMTLILTGEEKARLSGRITLSLEWLNEIIQKMKSNEVGAKEILNQTQSHIMLEMNESACKKSDAGNALKSFSAASPCDALNLSALELATSPGQFPSSSLGYSHLNLLRHAPLKAQSVSGSSASSYQASLDDAVTENSLDSDVKAGSSAVKTAAAAAAAAAVVVANDDVCGSSSSACDNFNFDVLQDHQTSRWKFNNNNNNVVDSSLGSADSDAATDRRLPGSEGDAIAVGDNFRGFDKKMRPVPELVVRASLVDAAVFMPKSFPNVVKYFKYVMNVALHRSAQRGEIPMSVCKEMESKILERIASIEGCSQAVDLVAGHLALADRVAPELDKVLHDVKFYSDSFVHYALNRSTCGGVGGGGGNRDVDEYYGQVLPLQLSFLFHLALMLAGEEKMKLSGSVTASLQWLNELVQKNRSGDVSMIDFFDRISRLHADNKTEDNHIKSYLLREAFNEFNMILGTAMASASSASV